MIISACADSLPPHANRDSGDFRDGSLPRGEAYRVGNETGAIVSHDGILQVGAFRLSIEKMVSYLDAFSRISKRIATLFPDKGALRQVLPRGEIAVPPSSMNFSEAFETFKLAQSKELSDGDFLSGKRTVERLKEGDLVSSNDLAITRGLLMNGARIATVCAGIDQAMYVAQSSRSIVQKGRDWLVDCAGSVRIKDGRIQANLREMVFENFRVESLRFDADLMAQRISLGKDGSSVVYNVGLAEHQSSELLSKGRLSRVINLSQTGIEGTLVVYDDRGAIVCEVIHRIPKVFPALQLGFSASQLLCQFSKRGIDPVRFARLVHRPTALGLKTCLDSLPDQAHVRLLDLDDWKHRFEAISAETLLDSDRRDLGALLLDAQQCLRCAAHLEVVTQTEDARSFWRRLWFGAMRDEDMRAAQELANQAPSPMGCDCAGAAEVLGSAATLLGYHVEDRIGAAWTPPENPVVSLTWALSQSGTVFPAAVGS